LEFVFWVLRYVFTFVAFLTGMKAPGILSARDISGETDEEVKVESGFRPDPKFEIQ
jgi:hypothetical protein